jgi:AraC-like DNA-binding protein
LREDKKKTVSEIAYDVGFTSLSYFTRRFHEKFGVSPTDWREGNKP